MVSFISTSISRSIARTCRSTPSAPLLTSSLSASSRNSAFRSFRSSKLSSSTSSRSSQYHLSQHAFSSHRDFSTTRPVLKTVQQLKARNSTGPFSWKAAALFLATGACLIVYFQYEKARLERKRIAEMSKGVGRPKVGGPFVLKDLNGNVFTEQNLKGKYSFVYFGFTHCPDICPEELDKMAEIIDKVRERFGGKQVMRPVFITCDPARDTPEVLRQYLREFHPEIIGLTGTYDQIKQVCKQYRVYFSTPKDVKPGEDYLVDHSIYFYLMDPEGDFVECIGRQDTSESAAKLIANHINDWRRDGKPLDMSED
ncbi:hypothetical protein VTO42DRAFT_484 [Malbranchea cinnamomea]